jgi:hypothetical protein
MNSKKGVITMKNTIKVEELLEKLDEVKTRYSYPSVIDSMIDEVIAIVENMAKTFSVGDTITVPLKGLGEFNATAQRVTDKGIIFMFDDCIDEKPMITISAEYMNNLCNAFPDNICNRITEIGLPTYGQIFGHDEFYEENLEPDNDDQFELMKIRKNRIADFKNECSWYWLRNSIKSAVSASNFAFVADGGSAYYNYASDAFGVRPVFTLSV